MSNIQIPFKPSKQTSVLNNRPWNSESYFDNSIATKRWRENQTVRTPYRPKYDDVSKGQAWLDEQDRKRRFARQIEEQKSAWELKRNKRREELDKLRKQEEAEEAARKLKQQKEDAKNEKLKKENEEFEEQEYEEWKKKHPTLASLTKPWTKDSVLDFSRAIFNIQNVVGSWIKGSSQANISGKAGEITMAEQKQMEADAHKKTLDLKAQLEKLQGDKADYINGYAQNGLLMDITDKINEYNASIDKIQKQLSNPELKQLDDNYKIDYYLDNGGLFKTALGMIGDTFKGISIGDEGQKQKLRNDVNNQRRNSIIEGYDNMMQKNFYDTLSSMPSNKNGAAVSYHDYDYDSATSYSNEQEVKKRQLRDDIASRAQWQDDMDKVFHVGKAYERGELLNLNASMFSPAYWYYVMPGMIGSSMSSTAQLKGQALQAGGAVVGAVAGGLSGGLSGAMYGAGVGSNIGTFLSTPYQLKGGVDENYAEIADKRADTIAKSILGLDPQVTADEVFSGKKPSKTVGEGTALSESLKKAGIKYWKSMGMSDEWINNRFNTGTDQDLINAAQDLIAGNIHTNNPKLAQIMRDSQRGLKAQFMADNVRTMYETPVLLAVQYTPTRFLKAATTPIAESAVKNGIVKQVERGLTKRVGTDAAGRATISAERVSQKAASIAERRMNDIKTSLGKFKNIWSATKSAYGTGAEVGSALGGGLVGNVVGGATGIATKGVVKLGSALLSPEAKAAAADIASGTMRVYQKIYDKLLPKDWERLALKYGLNAAGRAAAGSFSEGAEEGVQYLNSKENFAGKYGYDWANLSELIANDWKQGTRVMDAIGAKMGFGHSELMDDEEFWQNYKGGLALGFGHPLIMNVPGSIKGAYDQYKTDQLMTQQVVMSREVDKLNRAANAEFAKQVANGRGHALLESLKDAYTRDKRRENPYFTNEDYEDKIKAAEGIIELSNNSNVKLILEAKGFKKGTDRYANAIADIYNLRELLAQNSQSRKDIGINIKSLYNTKEFKDGVESIVDKHWNEDLELGIAASQARIDAAAKAEQKAVEEAKKAGTNTETKEFKTSLQQIRQDAMDDAEQRFKDNYRSYVTQKTHLVNRLRALVENKAKFNSLDDYFDMMSKKFNLKTKRPDSKLISKNVDEQIEAVKKQIKELDSEVDFGKTDSDLLTALNNMNNVVQQYSAEIQEQESTDAYLQADRAVTLKYLNQFGEGVVKNSKGKLEYNPAQAKKEKDKQRRLLAAMVSGDEQLVKEIEAEDTTVPKDESAIANNEYGRRIDAIIAATERNSKLNWMVADIASGDAVTDYMDALEEEKRKAAEEAKSKPKEKTVPDNQTPDFVPEGTKWGRTKVKRETKLREAKEKYEERKKKAQAAYERRKNKYKRWKRGNLNAEIIPGVQDAIVRASNFLMRSAEQGVYKFAQYVDDIKEIASDIDINDYLPTLRDIYSKAAAKFAFVNPAVLLNLSTPDEISAYGVSAEKKSYVRPEVVVHNKIQYRLDNDERKVIPNLSSYYMTVIKKEDGSGFTFCRNKSGLSVQTEFAQDEINKIIQNLKQTRENEELFIALLNVYSENSPYTYDEYVPYRNDDSVLEAIAYNIQQLKIASDSILGGIKTRELVLATLLGHEDQLDMRQYPQSAVEAINDIRELKHKLESAHYQIIATQLNIFDEQLEESAPADIILQDAEGNLMAIDVLSSYDDIRSRWDKNPSLYKELPFTIESKETSLLHSVEKILTNKFGANVTYLGVLPMTWNSRYSLCNVQKATKDGHQKVEFISVRTKSKMDADVAQQVDLLVNAIVLLTEDYNNRVDEITELNKEARLLGITVTDYSPITIVTSDDLDILNQQYESLKGSFDSILQQIDSIKTAMTQVRQQQLDNLDDVQIEPEVIPDDVNDIFRFLEDSCRELDSALSLVPVGRPINADERAIIKKIYSLVFDALSALNDAINHPTVNLADLTQYEQMIATAMEKLVENRENFGKMSMFMQQWWIESFAQDPDVSARNTQEKIPAGQNKVAYYNKIKSWIDSLRNHILNDLDGHPALQAWYESLLTNYFTHLLDNAEKAISPDQQNIIDDRLRLIIREGRELILAFEVGWGTQPDIAFPEPPKDELERINRMPVATQEAYGRTTSHSPAWHAMAIDNNYYWMSTQPDFLEKAKVSFIISHKHIYTNPRTNAKYVVEEGDVAMRIEYTDAAGKKHWAELPLIIDENYYPELTIEERQRIRSINRGQRKFAKKIKALLEYQKKHPDTELAMTVGANKGSVKYDVPGSLHSVTQFLFKGAGNERDLYTITSSKEDRIGICMFTEDRRTNTMYYDVYAGAEAKTRIGGFDDEFKKQHLQISNGMVVFFYHTGNNKYIGVPLTALTIDKSSAEKLADLLRMYAAGERYVDGFSIYDQLRMRLYMPDLNDNRVFTEYNNLNHYVGFTDNGLVTIGDKSFDPVKQLSELAMEIQKLPTVIDRKMLNEPMFSSDKSVFSEIRAKFRNNPSLQSLTMPNGFTISRDDLLHQNEDGSKGSTFLGYLLRNDYLMTRAYGKSYTQINVDNVQLHNKNDNDAGTPEASVKTATQSKKSLLDRRNRARSIFGLNYENASRPEESLTEEARNRIKEYMETVFGEDSGLFEFADSNSLWLEHTAGGPYVLGECCDNIIRLAMGAPESAKWHEAFHMVMELMLDDKTREQFYQWYRDRHPDVKLSDRDVAEGLADIYTDFKSYKDAYKKTKGFKKITKFFKYLAFRIGAARVLGYKGLRELMKLDREMEGGKFKNHEISEERRARFKQLFGRSLHYEVTDRKTGKHADFKYLENSADVNDMVKAIGYYAAAAFRLDDLTARKFNIKDATLLANALGDDLITELCGYDLEDSELTDIEYAFREVFHCEKQLVNIQKPGKKPKPVYIKKYPNLEILLNPIKDYIKSTITDYAGKIKQAEEDEDEDEKVQRTNIDKFDRAAAEFSKLDALPSNVKFFFATVPYLNWGEDESGARIIVNDFSKNRFQVPTFMPVQQVYNLVVNDMSGISSVLDLRNELCRLSTQKPMYMYLYKKFENLCKDIYTTNDHIVTTDYNKESYAISIANAVKSMKINYILAIAKTDKSLNTTIEIKGSSLERDSRQFSAQWTRFLTTGLVDVFLRDRDAHGDLVFKPGKENIFANTAQFFRQIQSGLNGAQSTFEVDGEQFNKDVYSDIDILKDIIIDKLNDIGIMFSKDALDYMLAQKYKSIDAEGLAALMNDRGKALISTFINMIGNWVSTQGIIDQAAVKKGYTANGFVKELGNMFGQYRRSSIQNQAQGLGGKRYFTISQNNSISNIVDAINTNDVDNVVLHTLLKFGYNSISDEFGDMGSILLKNVLKHNKDKKHNPKQRLNLFTYLGLKTNNRGDMGTEYKEEPKIDDYVTKMLMLMLGYMIFSTMADKGTWHCLNGVHIPGIDYNHTVDNYGNTTIKITGIPTIKWDKREIDGKVQYDPIITPSNEVLDLMIEYAYGERLAIQQCMEDLGYDQIDGYTKQGRKPLSAEAKIKNYHTTNIAKDKDGNTHVIEPNGTRFLSLTNIVIKTNDGEVKVINLNDPRISSNELLKLANDNFFNKDRNAQREIMARTLNQQYKLEVQKAIEMGLITRRKVSYANADNTETVVADNSSDTYMNLDNIKFDNDKIFAIQNELFDMSPASKRPVSPARNASFECCKGTAIAIMLADATTKAIICSQEEHRCFSGHPALFKVQYDWEKGCIKDSTFDIQKRIGGMVSTGEDNILDIPYIPSQYTCAECKDYEVASGAQVFGQLKEKFKDNAIREAYAIAMESYLSHNTFEVAEDAEKKYDKPWEDAYNYDISDLESESLPASVQKAVEIAKANAEKFYKAYTKEINVADGASYITADMCKNLLRMRGQYSGRVKAAFDLLEGPQQLSWLDSAEAYKTVYEAVNIVTTKYTAYGFRDHTLNGEEVSDVAVAYYNKFALFPLFPGIATGKLGKIYQKMKKERVDMLFMSSAVKVGSQGAVEFDGEQIEKPFNKYKQDYSFLRRQLNTDPEEGEKMNLGTQMVKIVMQNLRLGRTNYISAETGEQLSGQEILDDFMGSINKLCQLGVQKLTDEFCNADGSISEKKLSDYLVSQLNSRNANRGLIEAVSLNKEGHMTAPIAATSDSSWIESILISTVNKRVIDMSLPGSSFVQRSVFAMDGSSTEGGEIKGASVYNGKRLLMINEDKSMDAVISIDYFDNILPKRDMSFNEKRQWLIDNHIIGDGAKANTVGYRIPTQAQSSIHALRFVDVVNTVKSTVILPEEFTKITGSDFDIDHLYLSSFNYTINKDETVSLTNDGSSEEYYQNRLLYSMMTLLKDTDNSIHSLYKSIDNDTELPKSIADRIPQGESIKQIAYNFGTLHEQADRRLDYVTGKSGIGPFALNVTSHVLTCLFGVKFKDSEFARATGIYNFDKLADYNGNMISSWISAFINAHVDIVKDPWVSKLNINKYTYNMCNLLVRSGYGDVAMWFIAQPILRDVAEADSNAGSEFARNVVEYPSVYAAKKAAVNDVLLKGAFLGFDEEKLDNLKKEYSGKGAKNKHQSDYLRIKAVTFIKENKDVLEYIALHPEAKTVEVLRNAEHSVEEDGKEVTGVVVDEPVVFDVDDVQRKVYMAWLALEPYAKELGNFVLYTKIDTKKHGKSLIEITRYKRNYDELFNHQDGSKYEDLIQLLSNQAYRDDPEIQEELEQLRSGSYNSHSVWDGDSLDNLRYNSWIDMKTKQACEWPFKILKGQTFNGNDSFMSAVDVISDIFSDYPSTDLMNEVSRSMQTAIKLQYIIKYAKEYLHKTDKDITDLFIGNKSVARRLNRLFTAIRTNDKYKRLRGNYFLSQISSTDAEEPANVNGVLIEKPEFIHVSDVLEDGNLNGDLVIDAWEDMLNDLDKFVRSFARDLIVYAFLTSGEYKGWDRLVKYIPPAWIFGKIDTDYESFSDFVSKRLSNFDNEYPDCSYLADEIAANHADDFNFVKTVKAKNEKGEALYFGINGVITIGKSVKLTDSVPVYIRFKVGSSNNASDYLMYRLIDKIHLAGTHQANEKSLNFVNPVYARIKKKGYKSSVGNYNIYQYGWDFQYAENTELPMSSYDYSSEYKQLKHNIEYGGLRADIVFAPTDNIIDMLTENFVMSHLKTAQAKASTVVDMSSHAKDIDKMTGVLDFLSKYDMLPEIEGRLDLDYYKDKTIESYDIILDDSERDFGNLTGKLAMRALWKIAKFSESHQDTSKYDEIVHMPYGRFKELKDNVYEYAFPDLDFWNIPTTWNVRNPEYNKLDRTESMSRITFDLLEFIASNPEVAEFTRSIPEMNKWDDAVQMMTSTKNDGTFTEGIKMKFKYEGVGQVKMKFELSKEEEEEAQRLLNYCKAKKK